SSGPAGRAVARPTALRRPLRAARRPDTRPEPLRGAAQLELRVRSDPARHVHAREEQVAELLGTPLVGTARELGSELAQLVLEIAERTLDVGVLETDDGGAPLHLPRVEQGGQRLGHVVEDSLAAFLLDLDALPPGAHRTCGRDLLAAENMRMPPDELVVNRVRDRLEVAVALLLEQEREEVHLVEQVAELV